MATISDDNPGFPFTFLLEGSEIVLKFVSWSIMIAAVRYAETKAHSPFLHLLVVIVTICLCAYLYSHLLRIYNSIFEFIDAEGRFPALRFYVGFFGGMLLVVGLFCGALFLSGELVQGIVDMQTHAQC